MTADRMRGVEIRLKRAYEPPSPGDGARVLVDRLWPRGLRKDDAAIDCWMKEIAPSAELRRWFAHDPSRWDAFRRRYLIELAHSADLVDELAALARTGPVTLIFAARDALHNQAVVLHEILTERLDYLAAKAEAGVAGAAEHGSPPGQKKPAAPETD